jgi:hypothetical protein
MRKLIKETFTGYANFLTLSPDIAWDNKKLTEVTSKSTPAERRADKDYFHIPSKVPLAEFDLEMSRGLDLYMHFGEEHGRAVIGNVSNRGLKEGDVIIMHPVMRYAYDNKDVHYEIRNPYTLVLVTRDTIKVLRKKYPNLARGYSVHEKSRIGLAML